MWPRYGDQLIILPSLRECYPGLEISSRHRLNLGDLINPQATVMGKQRGEFNSRFEDRWDLGGADVG